MNKKFTVLFDLDGTLVDTAPDLIRAHNHVMKKFGYPSKSIDELRNAVGKKDLSKALMICNYLSSNSNKHPIQMTLSSLFNYFIQIFQYHSITNKSQNNVASILGINPFFVKDYIFRYGR